jgi:hypothetical protein
VKAQSQQTESVRTTHYVSVLNETRHPYISPFGAGGVFLCADLGLAPKARCCLHSVAVERAVELSPFGARDGLMVGVFCVRTMGLRPRLGAAATPWLLGCRPFVKTLQDSAGISSEGAAALSHGRQSMGSAHLRPKPRRGDSMSFIRVDSRHETTKPDTLHFTLRGWWGFFCVADDGLTPKAKCCRHSVAIGLPPILKGSGTTKPDTLHFTLRGWWGFFAWRTKG